ncbi:putative signal transducing protein [uncultured Hymenobacter sp.]|uniref:putative signal transducing protein n=1 Tax=uncultured Hymenobacter sp. TaxID=170016 RepID=UPI0035CC46E7
MPAHAIVVLTSFYNLMSAHVARTRLEAAGIRCFLSNETRPYGVTIGGQVRLHVREQDAAEAQRILSEDAAPMFVLPDEE